MGTPPGASLQSPSENALERLCSSERGNLTLTRERVIAGRSPGGLRCGGVCKGRPGAEKELSLQRRALWGPGGAGREQGPGAGIRMAVEGVWEGS